MFIFIFIRVLIRESFACSIPNMSVTCFTDIVSQTYYHRHVGEIKEILKTRYILQTAANVSNLLRRSFNHKISFSHSDVLRVCYRLSVIMLDKNFLYALKFMEK